MKIEEIKVKNTGYVHCYSNFYTSKDNLEEGLEYHFSVGVNKMNGEIDSGVWAISYLLSMYKYRPNDFILFEDSNVSINDDKVMSLDCLSQYSCYMDRYYPLFTSKKPVNKLIEKGIHDNKLDYLPGEIKELFMITTERYNQPLNAVGNEIFKAMAAIAYCNGKEVFCFPWLSESRFNYYHSNMTFVLDTLGSLKKIVILPVSRHVSDCSNIL